MPAIFLAIPNVEPSPMLKPYQPQTQAATAKFRVDDYAFGKMMPSTQALVCRGCSR